MREVVWLLSFSLLLLLLLLWFCGGGGGVEQGGHDAFGRSLKQRHGQVGHLVGIPTKDVGRKGRVAHHKVILFVLRLQIVGNLFPLLFQWNSHHFVSRLIQLQQGILQLIQQKQTQQPSSQPVFLPTITTIRVFNTRTERAAIYI